MGNVIETIKGTTMCDVLNDVTAALFSVSFSQLPAAKKHRKRCSCDVIKDVRTTQRLQYSKVCKKQIQLAVHTCTLLGLMFRLVVLAGSISCVVISQDFDFRHYVHLLRILLSFVLGTQDKGCVCESSQLLSTQHCFPISTKQPS